MKPFVAALSLLVFAPRPVPGQQTSTEIWTLLIDGNYACHVRKWDGGFMKSEVILATPGTDRVAKKQAGTPRCTPLVVELTLPPPKPVADWITAMMAGQTPRKTVKMNRVGTDNRGAGTGLKMSGCLLTRVAFPGVDAAATTTPAPLTLTFEGEQSKADQSENVAGTLGTSAKAWLPNCFKVSLDGATDFQVSKMEPFTVVLKTTAREVVEPPSWSLEAASLDIPNLAMTVVDSPNSNWKTWAENFASLNQDGDRNEKSGSLELLDSARQATTLTVTFSNLGVISLGREPVISGTQQVARVRLELYCEKMGVSLPTAAAASPDPAATPGAPAGPNPGAAPATNPPAAAPSANPPPAVPNLATPPANPGAAPAANPAAVPAAKTPVATNPADQGAHDPADFPRPDGLIRKSYTSTRNKILSSEVAEYSAKLAPSKLEPAYEKPLKDGGWEQASRTESGDPGKSTHSIVMSWKKGTRTAQLTLAQGKDITNVTVNLSEPVDLPRPLRAVPEKK